jgi:2-iminobutanoate/2-iminopropanoate deaminase
LSKKVVESKKLPPPTAPYSHAFKVRGGTLLFISGQVPEDSHGKVVSPGDFEAQALKVMENLSLVVEEAGGSVTDIFKITVLLTDQRQWKPFARLRKQLYVRWGIKHPPASTLFVVKSLAKSEWMLEVEATALLRK